MNTSMLWRMTPVFAFLWSSHSRLFGKVKTTSVSTMMKWRGIGEVGLAGAFGDNGTDITTGFTTRPLYTSPLALYTAPVSSIVASTIVDRHFRLTGYGTSSSSVKIIFLILLKFVPLLCWVDVRRYTPPCSPRGHSLPDSPCLLFYITLHSSQPSSPRHSSVPPPLYLHFHRPSSYVVLFSSHHMSVLTSSASSLELL